jgi:triosephosphate isomerase
MGGDAMRRVLIAGNWKMNGVRGDVPRLAGAIATKAGSVGAELALCPPATLLSEVGRAIAGTGVALGAQDCHAEASGAFTGDVSAPMLADLGCRYVIVGHSERRARHGESDADVRAKGAAALKAGLIAIICIGETLAERDGGRTLDVLSRQILGSVPDGATAPSIVVAYEPVWAIGTGRSATTAQIAEAHGAIRARLGERGVARDAVRLLYGGSVKPDNATAILALDDVDGALVGGASLDAAQFLAIAAGVPRR